MKVLLVSSWYPPVRSGSSLWAESLVGALRKRGHEVRVVTARLKGAGREAAAPPEESIYRLPAWRVPRNRLLLGLPNVPLTYSISNRRRVLEITRRFKPDVIHQINHIFDTAFLSAYAARKTGTPLVGSITTPIQSPSRFVHTCMHIADLAACYRFGVRHWQRIICSDSAQARYVTDAYGSRVDGRIVSHIFVGVHERVRGSRPVQKVAWPQIVMVGHVHAIRNPKNLIRAMPAVLEKFPDAKCTIAGRVQFNAPVKEIKRLGLESSVLLLGEVPVDRVAELVSSAHVFVILHTCRYAGLSFTAIEAMQYETPVVINAADDLYGPGTIRDGENIVLVNPDDVDEIAGKIVGLLKDAELRERIGRKGKEFVTSNLDWDLCAEKTEKLYGELL